MDIFDKFRQTLSSPPDAVVVDTAVADPDTMTTSSNTWATFVDSVEAARKKASSVIFADHTDPIDDTPVNPVVSSAGDVGGAVTSIPPNLSSEGSSEGSTTDAVASTVKSWWSEATAFFEETRIVVEERISEMTGPVEIKNDPLGKLRTQLALYTDSLEQLKVEAFSLGMGAENLARLGSVGLERAVDLAFSHSASSGVKEQFAAYKDKQEKIVLPVLDEVRSGVEKVTVMVTEEIGRIQAVQSRFKRRDRIHRSLSDMRSRVEIRRDKNNRRVAEGLPADAKSVEELYELTRAMDSIESDFRITSEQLVNKCEEILKNRSKQFHAMLMLLVEIQNTAFYRVGGSCSIPFQELFEAMKADEPPQDETEDLGPHALTYRSNHEDDGESGQIPSPQPGEYLKMSITRQPTVNIQKVDLLESVDGAVGGPVAGAASGAVSPSRYAYSRNKLSPVQRRASGIIDPQ